MNFSIQENLREVGEWGELKSVGNLELLAYRGGRNNMYQATSYKECLHLPLLGHLGDECHPKSLQYDAYFSKGLVVVECLRVCHHGW